MPDDLDYDPQLLQAMLGLDSLDNSEALSQMTNLDRAKALRQFNPGKGPSALGGAFRGIQTIAAAAKAKGLESKYADDQANSSGRRTASTSSIASASFGSSRSPRCPTSPRPPRRRSLLRR